MKMIRWIIPLLLILCSSCTPLSQDEQAFHTPDMEEVSMPVLDTTESEEWTISSFAEGLFVPWGMVFTGPDRLLVTERDGAIRVIERGMLQSEPLFTFEEVRVTGEAGLLDIALHPQYDQNKYIYVTLVTDGPQVEVRRLIDEGDRLREDTVIFAGLPTGQYHAGSRLLFVEDGTLYLTTGEGAVRSRAQEDSSLAGKLLHMTDEGDMVPGKDSYVVMKGLRNVQGIVPLDEETFFLTDHGPSGFDGRTGGDELNIVSIGDNLGWPGISHEEQAAGMVTAQKVYTPSVAPASAMRYDGAMFPEWQGDLFVGLLRGEGVERVRMTQEGTSWKILETERLPNIAVGRVRTIIQGPDGALYVSTSNRDGRGEVREGDDRIYRIAREN